MYTAHGQLSLDTLIRQHAPLVRRIAQHMMARLPPSVELDDLIQVGMIGLADALSRYETSHGVQFETFASQRIRGAMLDELRGSDWMSRSARKGQKDIESAIHRLEQSLGRAPKESEIAEAMELELAEYQELLGRVRGTQLIYLEDMGQNGDEGENFLDRHVADAQADPFAQLRDLENLPEREKYVMAMYYEHDMNLKEIAAVLEVTESRISQLHSQAIARLRTKMRLH